jgi:hypothetical protein
VLLNTSNSGSSWTKRNLSSWGTWSVYEPTIQVIDKNIIHIAYFTMTGGGEHTGSRFTKSTDGGVTWTNSTLPVKLCQSVGMKSLDDETVLVAYRASGNANDANFTRSTDGGLNWTTVAMAAPHPNGLYVAVDAISPSDVFVAYGGVASGTGAARLATSANDNCIYADLQSYNNSIRNNVLSSRGIFSSGITLADSPAAAIANTSVSGTVQGILLKSSNVTITNAGISSNNGTALRLDDASQNSTIVNCTLRTNATWIYSSQNSTQNNLTRTEFDSAHGTIRILPTVTMPGQVTMPQ